MLFDGAIKLVPWPIVTETMDRIGYGSSETSGAKPRRHHLVCTVLYAIPPTSIVGAILLTGYLGGAMASHVRIGSPLFTHILFGFYLGADGVGRAVVARPELARRCCRFGADLPCR